MLSIQFLCKSFNPASFKTCSSLPDRAEPGLHDTLASPFAVHLHYYYGITSIFSIKLTRWLGDPSLIAGVNRGTTGELGHLSRRPDCSTCTRLADQFCTASPQPPFLTMPCSNLARSFPARNHIPVWYSRETPGVEPSLSGLRWAQWAKLVSNICVTKVDWLLGIWTKTMSSL